MFHVEFELLIMHTLVAIDGSEHSFDAARALTHLAVPERLVLLHALEVPKPAYPMMMPEVAKDLYHIVERDMREDGERLLSRAASILPDGLGRVETKMEIGTPADVVVSTAERERSDVIVMGTRGLSPVKEILLGSVLCYPGHQDRITGCDRSAACRGPSARPDHSRCAYRKSSHALPARQRLTHNTPHEPSSRLSHPLIS